ncbi:MAG: leucine-rich repeat protein [Butyricicoccaceae bacterium]
MAIPYEKIIDTLNMIESLSEKKNKIIKHIDIDGNEFRFLSNGEEVVLKHADVKTAAVSLPAYITDEEGKTYKFTVIDSYAFSMQQELKYLVIPEGVVELRDGLFSNCGSLLAIVIPSTVNILGKMLWMCPTFEENAGGLIYYTGTKEQWKKLIDSDKNRGMMDYTPYNEVVRFISDPVVNALPEMDIQTVFDDDFEMEISRVRVCELGGEIIIPESYTDADGVVKKIIHIGRSSFAGNNKIQRVIIPPSIQRICQDAFYQCTNLREVVILKCDDELDIEMGAFFNCEHLEKVYIGRPCWWGEHALEKTNAQKIDID